MGHRIAHMTLVAFRVSVSKVILSSVAGDCGRKHGKFIGGNPSSRAEACERSSIPRCGVSSTCNCKFGSSQGLRQNPKSFPWIIVLSRVVYQRMKEKYPEFVERLEKHGLLYTRVLGEDDNPNSPIGRGLKSTFLTNHKTLAQQRFFF